MRSGAGCHRYGENDRILKNREAMAPTTAEPRVGENTAEGTLRPAERGLAGRCSDGTAQQSCGEIMSNIQAALFANQSSPPPTMACRDVEEAGLKVGQTFLSALCIDAHGQFVRAPRTLRNLTLRRDVNRTTLIYRMRWRRLENRQTRSCRRRPDHIVRRSLHRIDSIRTVLQTVESP